MKTDAPREGGRRWFGAAVLLFLALVAGLSAAAEGEPGQLTVGKMTNPGGGKDFQFVVGAGLMEADLTEVIADGLRNPRGLATAPSEYGVYLYYTDPGRFRIHKLEYYEPAFLWEELAVWGGKGAGDGKFLDPVGIATDSAGNVYVTDAKRADVQVFDADGNYLRAFGGEGDGDGRLKAPSGIAVDADGFAYVADTVAARILVFDGDGRFVRTVGQPGSGDGMFVFPVSLAFDEEGDLYVVDRDLDRIQVFSPNGVFLRAWGGSGTEDGQFDRPYGISIAPPVPWYTTIRLVNVTDATGRAQVFDRYGVYLGKWGSDGGEAPVVRGATGIAHCVDGPCVAYQGNDTVVHFYSWTEVIESLDDWEGTTITPRMSDIWVGELVRPGWHLESIFCTAGQPARFGNSVRLTLTEGQVTTCGFNNHGSPIRHALFAPVIAADQTPEVIDMGDVFNIGEEFAAETLTEGKVHRWTVELFEGESIAITAIAPAPADIVLSIARDGVPIVDRQNTAGPGEAETIRGLPPPGPGVYDILVETVDRVRAEYALAVFFPGYYEVEFVGFLEPGTPVEDVEMAAGKGHYWFFVAEAADKLSLTLTPDTESDIVGDLYGPGATYLEMLDIGWQGEVESLEDYPLPASGLHTLRVSEIDWKGMTYSLVMDLE